MYVITCKCKHYTTDDVTTAFLIADPDIEFPYWSITMDPYIAQFSSIDRIKTFWEKHKKFVQGRDPLGWNVIDDTIHASEIVFEPKSDLSY